MGIRNDKDAIQKILSTIDTTFVHMMSPLPLHSISTGVMVTDKVTLDMMSAKTVGKKKAIHEFIGSTLSD